LIFAVHPIKYNQTYNFFAMNYFEKVKSYLLELQYNIVSEDATEQVFVIENEEAGIKNMIVDCEDPILILEQHIFDVKQESLEMYRGLLKKNREIVHGSFVLDDSGNRILFRDTLQLENLDLNELEGSLNALTLLLGEYYEDLIRFSK
jgi:hypothetical protein